jgi:hypothetical protein
MASGAAPAVADRWNGAAGGEGLGDDVLGAELDGGGGAIGLG